jgi:hypothetical protein
MKKPCTRCKIEKELTEFHAHKGKKDGRRSLCKLCRKSDPIEAEKARVRANRYRKKYPEKVKANAKYFADKRTPENRRKELLKNKYGLTPEDVPDACELCGKKWKINVDHCHVKGHVRGFLCLNCNHAIGLAKDNPSLLRRMADYLEKDRRRS